MKVAIIGYGVEGQAAYRYWQNSNDITICDQNKDIELPAGTAGQLGEGYLNGLDAFDIIVRSPFVRPDAITAANTEAVASKVTSSTNEFMRVCPSRNIIGITGTKGKGTTSTLVARMLEAAGKRVHLGGNIGVAALDLLNNDIQAEDYIVLELSSFQLIDLQQSPALAACLMVVPEHQDWHLDVDEYYHAKQQLFAHQTVNDVAVFYPLNDRSVAVAGASPGQHIPYTQKPGAINDNDMITIADQPICPVAELKLLGGHNIQNVCAAVTIVWQITQDVSAIRSVLTSFSGLEHRLELVRELDNVRFYDDSFGTTPETAMVAIEAFDAPKIVILGGSDKGANYNQLADVVAANDVRKVLLIGDQAEPIRQALEAAGFDNYVAGGHNMQEIVELSRSFAVPGDVVLLSTGCDSFDMFANYKDRGNQFKQAVQALA